MKGFNLVLENLLISTRHLRYGEKEQMFQSRTRESSYFNLPMNFKHDDSLKFQSRTRESSYFNHSSRHAPPCRSPLFQSRTRESSYFNPFV